MTTSLANSPNELRLICELPTGSALPRAARFLADLVKEPAFLGSQILPLLREARYAEGWYVARRYDAHDGAYSLQVFVWPPGTGTRGSTTTPPGAPTPAPSVWCSKSATTASTTAPKRGTPA
jgi:hypothetical protein